MWKLLKTLILIIWIIDILNIDFVINNVHIAELLDEIVPLNTIFWILFWLLVPSADYS